MVEAPTEVKEPASGNNLVVPGGRPSLMGQNTKRLLAEMGDDLAGMGAGGAFDENDYMARQPTAMQKDPAMMTGAPANIVPEP